MAIHTNFNLLFLGLETELDEKFHDPKNFKNIHILLR